MRVLLLAAVLLGLTGSAVAQDVELSFEVDNRRVVISWNKAPGDTLTLEEIDLIRSSFSDSLSGMPARGFARYQLWRSITPDKLSSFELLRSYSVTDSTWGFLTDRRVFIDPDSIIVRGPEKDPDYDEDEYKIPGLHNGFDYYYAITWDEATTDKRFGFNFHTFYTMQTIAEGISAPVQPQRPAYVGSPVLEEVDVVPNPYNPALQSGHFPDSPRIQFVGLPGSCSISIYTAAGDLVRVLDHESPADARNWDLKNNDDQDVATGVYFYRVEAGTQFTLGRFVVIR